MSVSMVWRASYDYIHKMYTDVQCCGNVKYGREDLNMYLRESCVYVAQNVSNYLWEAKEFQAKF
jgi:hypothetical protein